MCVKVCVLVCDGCVVFPHYTGICVVFPHYTIIFIVFPYYEDSCVMREFNTAITDKNTKNKRYKNTREHLCKWALLHRKPFCGCVPLSVSIPPLPPPQNNAAVTWVMVLLRHTYTHTHTCIHTCTHTRTYMLSFSHTYLTHISIYALSHTHTLNSHIHIRSLSHIPTRLTRPYTLYLSHTPT